MTETKSEKFIRIRDMRLPKITHAIGLLENLSGAAYASTPDERVSILTELYAKVDELSAQYAIPIRDQALRVLPAGESIDVVPSMEPDHTPVINTPGRVGTTAPPWASVADMAREVSLEDLSGAMCIYMDRMSDVLRKQAE